MQVERALSELGQLADAACDGDPRHRMAGEVFEHAPGKVAHVEQAFVRGIEQLAGSLLRAVAGRADDVVDAERAGDVDATVDGMDPRAAGIGDDDPGGAEDRQTTDHPEAWVQGLAGHVLTAGDGQSDNHVRDAAAVPGLQRGGDLLARPGGDRGLADGDGQAGFGHGANTLAGLEPQAAAAGTRAQAGFDERAMGDVGVVAGVLDDAGLRPGIIGIVGLGFVGEGESRGLPAGECQRHRVFETTAGQRLEGSSRGSRRAGTRGPAPAQGRGFLGSLRRWDSRDAHGGTKACFGGRCQASARK